MSLMREVRAAANVANLANVGRPEPDRPPANVANPANLPPEIRNLRDIRKAPTCEARELLAAAARQEAVEFEHLLAHLAPEDWQAYAARDLPDLRRPEVAAAVVRGIVAAVESGRCSCSRCRGTPT